MLTCVRLHALAPRRCGDCCPMLLDQRRFAAEECANTWHETLVERKFMFAAGVGQSLLCQRGGSAAKALGTASRARGEPVARHETATIGTVVLIANLASFLTHALETAPRGRLFL